MSLRPFFEASLAIQIHQITAILALFLGAAILWRRKGSEAHKRWGKIWVGLMLVTAVSSIFIYQIKMWGNYSPVHLLTLVVLINMPLAIWYARRGNIAAHKSVMQGTFIGGMIIAGGLTFLPGRLNFEILFGESMGIGAMWGAIIGVGSAIVVGIIIWVSDGRIKKA